MLVKLKDLTGSTVMVNSELILFIGQAADSKSKQPLLGQSIIFMQGSPLNIEVKGSPEDVATAVEKQVRLIAN